MLVCCAKKKKSPVPPYSLGTSFLFCIDKLLPEIPPKQTKNPQFLHQTPIDPAPQQRTAPLYISVPFGTLLRATFERKRLLAWLAYFSAIFRTQVYVVDQHESLQRGEELPLKVTLSHYVNNAAAGPGVLVMDPVAPKISNGGKE